MRKNSRPSLNQPYTEHENPIKPDQTHDDVGKNVANAIFANETISFDFYLNYAMTIVKNLELPFKSLLNQVECIL